MTVASSFGLFVCLLRFLGAFSSLSFSVFSSLLPSPHEPPSLTTGWNGRWLVVVACFGALVGGLGIHKFISTTEVGSWLELSFGGKRVVQRKEEEEEELHTRRRKKKRISTPEMGEKQRIVMVAAVVLVAAAVVSSVFVLVRSSMQAGWVVASPLTSVVVPLENQAGKSKLGLHWSILGGGGEGASAASQPFTRINEYKDMNGGLPTYTNPKVTHRTFLSENNTKQSIREE